MKSRKNLDRGHCNGAPKNGAKIGRMVEKLESDLDGKWEKEPSKILIHKLFETRLSKVGPPK